MSGKCLARVGVRHEHDTQFEVSVVLYRPCYPHLAAPCISLTVGLFLVSYYFTHEDNLNRFICLRILSWESAVESFTYNKMDKELRTTLQIMIYNYIHPLHI